jgi:hypothetical protein
MVLAIKLFEWDIIGSLLEYKEENKIEHDLNATKSTPQ